MPASPTSKASLALICGDDDYNVRLRSRQLYQLWTQEIGGMDHEIIEAVAANGDEAAKCIARLHQALQTLPFFGTGKVVWFKDCSFLSGEDRVSGSGLVTEMVNDLAQSLKDFNWQGVRLVVSAGKVHKGRTFFKTLSQIGQVEVFEALSLDDKDWTAKAEQFARANFQERKKDITEEALGDLVEAVGPNLQQLGNEIEKLSLFVGDRPTIRPEDVTAIVTRQKQARAFALGDALGDRDLPRLLRNLDEELWTMQFDKDKSELGLLYGLIGKVRAMLFAKELIKEGLLKLESKYYAFKSQLEKLPPEKFPEDKKLSPLGVNPYVLFRASQQSANYSRDELIRAMELLLQANLKMVSSGLDEAMVLQQTLVRIVGASQKAPGMSR